MNNEYGVLLRKDYAGYCNLGSIPDGFKKFINELNTSFAYADEAEQYLRANMSFNQLFLMDMEYGIEENHLYCNPEEIKV